MYSFWLRVTYRNKNRKEEESNAVLEELVKRFVHVSWEGEKEDGYNLYIITDVIDDEETSDYELVNEEKEALNIIEKTLDKLEGGE